MAPNRKNVQAKLILYDMKGYESVKIVQNMKDIAVHNKTYEIVVSLCKKAQNALHNKKMELAEKLLKEVYVKLTKVSVKHPISVDEFVNYLRKKDALMTFTQNMSSVADSIAKVMKYEGVITKSITAIQRLKELYSKNRMDEKDISAIKTNISQLKKDRNELRAGYEKMRVVVSFLKIANEFMPSGADTMLDLNFTVFEEAGKTIDRVEKHAEKITVAVREAGKLGDVIGSNKATASKTLQFDDKNKRAHKNLTTDQYLDLVLGRPR